jgi:hypothetical protein
MASRTAIADDPARLASRAVNVAIRYIPLCGIYHRVVFKHKLGSALGVLSESAGNFATQRQALGGVKYPVFIDFTS